ncbi:cysteine desulfurase family protein [Candidatus Uabimicrobium sp. HlEnr_7]|uniref:cysteine desulfurase family protein n=1 Tax=Candidatus Uabimicrobium helgolandensis TaxID=3095367 RepID=UPI003556DD60
MFRKVVQVDCMKRRVVKYYSTIPMSTQAITRFEKYGEIVILPLLKTYKVNIPHQFLIQGIVDGYQFSVSYKNENWQELEQQFDCDLEIAQQSSENAHIYLDYNATTPVDPRVVQKMMPFLQDLYGNPSSAHSMGQQVQNCIKKARQQVAAILDCDPQQLIFTSGGTESINHALLSATNRKRFFNQENKRHKIITAKTEHSATLKTCDFLKNWGFDIEYLPIIDGIVSLEVLEKLVNDDCLLVTLSYINNEVGTIQPIEKIADIVNKSSAKLHIDAVQALGKVPISTKKIPIDFLSVSAHKIYGPKGIGALYIKNPNDSSPLLCGGKQEYNLRGGTENVVGIIGMGEACQIAQREIDKNNCHLHTIRKEFLKLLSQKNINSSLNHNLNLSFPSTLNIYFADIDGDTLMIMLNEKGIIVSRGSACNAHAQEPSPVLLAMAIPTTQAQKSLRFSFGKYTNNDEIRICVETIDKILQSLKKKVT